MNDFWNKYECFHFSELQCQCKLKVPHQDDRQSDWLRFDVLMTYISLWVHFMCCVWLEVMRMCV